MQERCRMRKLSRRRSARRLWPVGVTAGAEAPSLDALARRSLAQLDGTLTVPGLRRRARSCATRGACRTSTRASTDDLFFAQGYVMAQDRLWQMEMWRRGGRGPARRGPRARRASARSPGAPAEVPRPDGRPRVGELSPRRRRIMSGVRQGRERVHRQPHRPCPSNSC